jgi:hypothetical protein
MQLDASVANVQLSAVGDKAVVLDRTKQLIWFEGADKPIDMPMGSRAQLAQPVPSLSLEGGNLGAVVATPTGIVGVTRKALVSLSGAMPEGVVEAPVSANGCVYGVVGTKVATSCPGKSPVVVDIPNLSATASLAIRVNGDNVILNDVKSGDIWLVTDGMRRISDWSKVTPAEAAAKKDTPSNDATKVNPDRTGANRPPVANDDSVTVRAGRSTILPILDNDSDPDGDIITVVETPSAGDGVTLQLVRGGAGLQAVVAANASGARSFSYTITDGRGGYSQPAHVTLSIESADQSAANQPPVLHNKDTVIVASGQQTQIRELLRWRDPDGDDMVLTSASVTQGDDEVSFTPDGTITFTDVGKVIGLKTINVIVSDGSAKTQGTLLLDVRKPQDVTPIANGDYARAMTNQEIQVSPLDNDQGVNLALASVDAPSPQPTKFTVDYTTRTFRFKASSRRYVLRRLHRDERPDLVRARAHRRRGQGEREPSADHDPRRGAAHARRLGDARPAAQRRGPGRRRPRGAVDHEQRPERHHARPPPPDDLRDRGQGHPDDDDVLRQRRLPRGGPGHDRGHPVQPGG